MTTAAILQFPSPILSPAGPVRFTAAERMALIATAYSLKGWDAAFEFTDDGDEWAALVPGDCDGLARFIVWPTNGGRMELVECNTGTTRTVETLREALGIVRGAAGA